MSVASLNNMATGDAYTDALTVVFGYPRAGFSAQVTNAAVTYQVAIVSPTGRDYVWESTDHFTVPSLLNFRDPAQEGFPQGSKFAGIRFKSAAAGAPGRVTVA